VNSRPIARLLHVQSKLPVLSRRFPAFRTHGPSPVRATRRHSPRKARYARASLAGLAVRPSQHILGITKTSPPTSSSLDLSSPRLGLFLSCNQESPCRQDCVDSHASPLAIIILQHDQCQCLVSTQPGIVSMHTLNFNVQRRSSSPIGETLTLAPNSLCVCPRGRVLESVVFNPCEYMGYLLYSTTPRTCSAWSRMDAEARVTVHHPGTPLPGPIYYHHPSFCCS
jgi:hypothetical protein